MAAIVCIGGIVFWINLKNKRSHNRQPTWSKSSAEEHNPASVAIGGLTAAQQRENVALTEVESKRIANSKQGNEKQDESEARSKALGSVSLQERKQRGDARQMEMREALN